MTTRLPPDTRVAITVNPALGAGLAGNTIATIAIGLAVAVPQLGGSLLVDHHGVAVHPSAAVPVPILQADSSTLRRLLDRALPGGPETVVVPFPAFARSMHDFPTYQQEFTRRDLSAEVVDGVGIAGPKNWVASLTGSLRLLS